MKITSYIHILSTLAISVIGSEAIAQDTQSMSLEQAINTMLESNRQLKMAEQQSSIANADVMKANSVFLPSVSVSETFTTTTDPMMAFGTKLGQSAITAPDFNPDLLNDPNAINNFATRVEFVQPILNLDGIYGRQAAKAVSDATQHQQVWSQEMMVLHTKMMYYQLVLAKKGKETVDQAVITAKANYQTAQNLFDQGIITNADLMGAELRYT
jgi:outer membrane protein TolC